MALAAIGLGVAGSLNYRRRKARRQAAAGTAVSG